MAVAPQPGIPEIVRRLVHAKRRIVQTVVWATRATEAWTVLNDFTLRGEFEDTAVHAAVATIQRATLDSRILMTIRLFDPPGQRGALASDKISFPVCVELIAIPGVAEALADHAAFLADEEDKARIMVADRIVSLTGRLRAIGAEEPNRAKRIRDFRNENIAHELRPLDQARPEYRDLRWLLAEATEMAADLALVTVSEALYLPSNEVARSAEALWDAVAAAHPHH